MAESVVKLRIDSQEWDNKLKNADNGLTRFFDHLKQKGQSVRDADAETLKYVQALGQMETKSSSAKGKIAEMSRAFLDLSVQYRQLSETEKSSQFGQTLGKSLDDLKARIVDAKKELNDIGKSIGNIPTGTKEVGGSGFLSGLGGALDAAQGGISGLLGSLGKFGPQAAAIGAVSTAVVGLGSSAIDSRKNIESLELNLGTLLGSAEKGKALVKELQQYGQSTPYDTAGLAEAARTMLSYGVNAEQIMPLMQQLGDVAQGDANRLNSLALAFGQMTAVGTVQKQDLNQMANAGFGFNEIAKSMGISVSEFLDMVSKKKVSVTDISKALHDATSEGGLFYNSAKNASKGLEGTFSNFEESLENTKAQLGKLIEPAVLNVVNTLGDSISKVTANLDQAQAIGSAFSAVGSTISVVLRTVIEVGGAVAKAVGSIVEAFSKLLDMGGINLLSGITDAISMLLSPITGLANLITETIDKITGGSQQAVSAINDVAEAGREESKVEKQRKEDQDAVAKSAAGVVAQYNQLKKEWDSLKGSVEQSKWIKKHASDFNELGMTVNSVNDAYDYFVRNSARVVKALEAMARAEALKDLYKKAYQEQYEQENAPGSVARGDYYIVHHEGERLQPGDYDRYGLSEGDIYNKPGEVGQFLNASGVRKANTHESTAANQRLNKNLAPYRSRTQRILKDMNSAQTEAEEAAAGLNLNPGGGMSMPGRHTTTTKHGKTTYTPTPADRAVTAQGYYDETARKVSEFERQMQEKIAANAIEAMDDGEQKQLAQIEANRKKELDALTKSVADLAKQAQENDKKAWLKSHPKSGPAAYAKTENGKLDDEGWQKYILNLDTADGKLGDIIAKAQEGINLKFDKQAAEVGVGSLKDLNTQLQILTNKQNMAKSREEWISLGKEIDNVREKIEAITAPDFSSLTTSNISGFISEANKQRDQSQLGSADYQNYDLQSTLATAFQNLLQAGGEQGINFLNQQGVWSDISSGDIDGALSGLKEMLSWFNQMRGLMGQDAASIDAKGNIVGSDGNSLDDKKDDSKDKLLGKIDGAIGAVSQLTSGLQAMGIKVPSSVSKLISFGQGLLQVIQAVQAIISIFSTTTTAAQIASTTANTAAIAANTIALGVNSGFKLFGLSTGGLVHAAGGYEIPGNHTSGDLVPAMVNSGELVLNRAQQGNLAAQLDGGRQDEPSREPYVTGENIFLGLTAYMKQNNIGESAFFSR